MLITAFLIFLNLFQTWQYNEGILHGTLVSEMYYWKIFLKTTYDPKNEKLLDLQNEIDYEYGW
jgi:hypothetical protein